MKMQTEMENIDIHAPTATTGSIQFEWRHWIAVATENHLGGMRVVAQFRMPEMHSDLQECRAKLESRGMKTRLYTVASDAAPSII